MKEEITRREFLDAVGQKARGPLRILARIFAIVFVSWVIVLLIALLRGVTFHGWMFLGGLMLVFLFFALVRGVAARVYAGCSARGRALCDALRESIRMLILVGVGILAWHKFQIDETVSAILLLTGLAVAISQKGLDRYRERMGHSHLNT